MRSEGSATARAALAGNPSDGYGGGVLAVCVAPLAATVVLERVAGTRALVVVPAEATGLVCAAATRHARATGIASPAGVAAAVATTIPREVGLAGSSAIVIATLRALDAWHATALPRDELALVALAAEADLGIAAGLQDRVAQAYGGLTAMTFPTPQTFTARGLDPALLPPLFLAWDPRGADGSGGYHAALRARFDAGEPAIRAALDELAALAAAAADAVERRDSGALGAAMDASHDLRAALGPIAPRHAALRDAVRDVGLACNSAGSGGAVVGLATDLERVATLRVHLTAAGSRLLTLPPADGGARGARA